MEKSRISQADLAALLMQHLNGTAFVTLAENTSYVRDSTGFVAIKTIDNIRRALEHGIQIMNLPISKSPRENIKKVRDAINAIKIYGTDETLN